MADIQILRAPAGAVPSNYTLPDAAELRLKAVYAEFVDNGAGSDWLPTVTILSDSGHELARAADQDVLVTAGQDADVSWFPRVRRRRAVATTEPRFKLLGSANGTDTLTITLDAAVPADGLLFVVAAQATVGDSGDTGSEINSASDSQGVAGWLYPLIALSGPLIGYARQTDGATAPNVTSQVGSAYRVCTAGDLGVGDTITLTYTTADPGLFHTAALAIYVRGFSYPFPVTPRAVTQGGTVEYANGDSYPDNFGSPTFLSWDIDYPGDVSPDVDALCLSAMGAYPATPGWNAYVGTVIGEKADGVVSIAAGGIEVAALANPDPGGTWPAGADHILGNYQMIYPRTFS